MSELVKQLGDIVIDMFPVILFIGVILALTIGGGLNPILSILTEWMLGT